MVNLVVLNIKGAPKSLTGYIQRIMLEIRPGTFVWKLSSKKTRQIWDEIKNTNCSAVCVSSAKTESGFVVVSHGKNARMIHDNYGLQLVQYQTQNALSTPKAGESQPPEIIV